MSFVNSALLFAATALQTPAAAGDPADFWWGDYDGDGLADALVHTPPEGTRLLRNLGDGTLADVTVETGLAGLFRPGFVLWGDYDADGARDLYVGSPQVPGRLYHNEGGLFVDVTQSAGVQRARGDRAGTWIDYDGDGLLDLHLSGSAGHSLFRNLAAGGFAATALPLALVDGTNDGLISTGGAEDPTVPPTSGGAAPGSSSGLRDFGGPLAGGGFAAGGGNGPIITPGAVNPMPMNILDCVNSIKDQSGGCLEASSAPTLGMLYPLSSNLYVSSTNGFVGVGTTSPFEQLHVEGDQYLSGAMNTQSVQFGTRGNPSIPMMLTQVDGLTERMVLAESMGTYQDTGLKYDPSPFQFLFQHHDSSPPALVVDLNNGVVGIGTDVPNAELHIADTSDARLLLESDTDNSGEGDQPHIQFSQDGGVVQGRIGYFDSSNHLSLMNLYDYGHLFFKVPQVSTNNFFEFHNTSLGGTTFDVEARLDEFGDWQIDGSVSSPAADLAEIYPVAGAIEPGDVVAFSGNGPSISRAQAGDEARLAGVVSSQPAFIMGLSYTDENETGVPFGDMADADRFGGDTTPYRVNREVLHEIQVNGRAPLALAGRVPVKISAENGAIQPGDLLTLSSIPGHAMKATETGLTIGTALEAWTTGEGKILAFVRTGWFAPGPDAAEMATVMQRLDSLQAQIVDLQQQRGLSGR